MNKYIIFKRNALVKLDTDKLDVDHIDHNYDIDRMWFIEEDGIIVREGEEYEVKKVLLFYSCIVLEAEEKKKSLLLIIMI